FDPNFVDRTSATMDQTFLDIWKWRINASLGLRADAARPRSERIKFTLYANIQEVLTAQTSPPLPAQETISLSGRDVGQQIPNVLDGFSVSGKPVEEGQVVYPDSPSVPGGSSYQICIQAGTAGIIEPEFSDIPGQTTNDGTVVWACLGSTLSSAS